MSLGRSESALLYLLLDAGTLGTVDFIHTLLEKLLEEGVPDALGIEGGIGIVVPACLVTGEEQHELGELVLADFGGKGRGEQVYAVGYSLVAAGAGPVKGKYLQVYPVAWIILPVQFAVLAECGTICQICPFGILCGVSPIYGRELLLDVRMALPLLFPYSCHGTPA